MSIANHFYNATTRRYIAYFGNTFNKISITRSNVDTKAEVQKLIVPISYGPYQKFLARITQDPDLDKKPAITLPRMAFEITGMSRDGQRKLTSLKKIRSDDNRSNFQYVPAPYNINFTLYIMTKYNEDGIQILEQILPFFNTEWTDTISLIPGIDPFDVPIVLNDVSAEDMYEGEFDARRSLLWTLSFTMKAWYFGPNRQKKLIKFVDTRFYDLDTLGPNGQVTIQPGLTANGEPTSVLSESIPFADINADDDWDIIEIIRDDILDE